MPNKITDDVKSSHRLAILSQQEIDDLLELPQFTDEEQELYFDFSATELTVIATKTFSGGVYLALELGYFKAKRQFSNIDHPKVMADLQYLINRYFGGRNDPLKVPSRPIRLINQRTILELLNYRICNKDVREELEGKALRITMLSTQPVFILRELLHYMTSQRVVAPVYSTLQDMVGRAVNHERSRVLTLLAETASTMVLEQLDDLLNADEKMYRITNLKKEPKNFSHKELKQEVVRLITLESARELRFKRPEKVGDPLELESCTTSIGRELMMFLSEPSAGDYPVVKNIGNEVIKPW